MKDKKARIALLYETARRFDEGELCSSTKFRDVVRTKTWAYEEMLRLGGDSISDYLDKYTEAMYEEMELEAQHFFAEGYMAGHKE